MNKKRIYLTACSLLLCFIFLAGQTTALAESITIAPYRIILNAKGQFEDLHVVVRMPIPAGYQVTDTVASLYFNGIEVSQAFAAVYCYIDDNLLVSFDRTELQANPDVVSMANSVVQAEIVGYVVLTNADGDEIQQNFSGIAPVEILKPGK